MSCMKLWLRLIPICLILFELFSKIRCYENIYNKGIRYGTIVCTLKDICLRKEECEDYLPLDICMSLNENENYELNNDYLKHVLSDRFGKTKQSQKEFMETFDPNVDFEDTFDECILETFLVSKVENLDQIDVPSWCKFKYWRTMKKLTESKLKNLVQPEYFSLNAKNNLQNEPKYLKRFDSLKYSDLLNKNDDFDEYASNKEKEADGKGDNFDTASNLIMREPPARLVRPRRYAQYDLEQNEEKSDWAWVSLLQQKMSNNEAATFLNHLSVQLGLLAPITEFLLRNDGKVIHFKIPPFSRYSAQDIIQKLQNQKLNLDGVRLESMGVGQKEDKDIVIPREPTKMDGRSKITLIVCSVIMMFVLLLFVGYAIQVCSGRWRYRQLENDVGSETSFPVGARSTFGQNTVHGYTSIDESSAGFFGKIKDYMKHTIFPQKKKPSQRLYSGDMESFQSAAAYSRADDIHSRTTREFSASDASSIMGKRDQNCAYDHASINSDRASVSSWSSEPVTCTIDAKVGHLILSYLEGYFQNKDRLSDEWNLISHYESEEGTPSADASKEENVNKNRSSVPIPYEHSRVRLRNVENDYINASLLYDHSPRNPVYIAAPSPSRATLCDFWQLVWEQCSVVLICLEGINELTDPSEDVSREDQKEKSVRYWPTLGTKAYGNFEVHLVSEHNICESYTVRSFYLKNVHVGETRTVTQFHYNTWNEENLTTETLGLLAFRRKANRSFRGMMSPMVVHCADGCGRTGTYVLLDLVLSRILRGMKEIDIAASIEHLRDQRPCMVRTKEQYAFVFTAVAQEVDAMLKAGLQTM